MTIKAFLPAIGWALFIFTLSAGPGISLPVEWWKLFSPDKWGHAIVYGILSVLILWGFAKIGKTGSPFVFWGFSIAAGYGIAMELMQYTFFPGRYFEVLDIIANIIGSIIGLVLFRKFH